MSAIDKRIGRGGKVSWRARVMVDGRVARKTFKRKTDASSWAAETETKLRAGDRSPDRSERKRTISDLIDRYCQDVLPGYDEKERGLRDGKLAWWRKRIGEKRLREVRRSDIAACLDALTKGDSLSGKPVSPATQGQYLAVLRHVLSRGVKKWEWLEDNPASLVEPPKKPRGRVRFLSVGERRRLLKACAASKNRRLLPLVQLALATGARQGELLALRWCDVDFPRAQATVEESKNDERRPLALSSQAVAVLRQMRKIRQIHSDLVFATAPSGKATVPRKAWEAALRKAKIEDFRFHDLRHTFASYLAMSGATLPELAAALGHKTLAMVQRYAHLTPAHTAGVVNRMSKKFLSQDSVFVGDHHDHQPNTPASVARV
jgi:integrase